MSSKVGKFAPIGVVAVAMGYFCWTHLDDPAGALVGPPPAKATSKATELTAALLSPPPSPDPVRDPFASQLTAAPTETAKPDSGQLTHDAAAKPAPAPPPRPDFTTGLVLNGTYVRGARRMAIINGSLYSEGQDVSPVGSTSAPTSLERVDVDRVVLKQRGEPAELLYVRHESQKPVDRQQAASVPREPSPQRKADAQPKASAQHDLGGAAAQSGSQPGSQPGKANTSASQVARQPLPEAAIPPSSQTH